jgi:hypothetical protein
LHTGRCHYQAHAERKRFFLKKEAKTFINGGPGQSGHEPQSKSFWFFFFKKEPLPSLAWQQFAHFAMEREKTPAHH